MARMVPMSSTSIAAIGYEAGTQELIVRFTSGKTYTFPKVPQDVYDDFLVADSAGTYFNENIKGVYG